MTIDPSIAIVNTGTGSAAIESGSLKKNVDLDSLMDMRQNDWAFHFFKQNEGTKLGQVLHADKCNRVDSVTFFGFVRAWWFDNKLGKSDTGTAPKFLRVLGDNVCLCPMCREGFDQEKYKDDLCTCWKVHNLVFKCSVK